MKKPEPVALQLFWLLHYVSRRMFCLRSTYLLKCCCTLLPLRGTSSFEIPEADHSGISSPHLPGSGPCFREGFSGQFHLSYISLLLNISLILIPIGYLFFYGKGIFVDSAHNDAPVLDLTKHATGQQSSIARGLWCSNKKLLGAPSNRNTSILGVFFNILAGSQTPLSPRTKTYNFVE
jgi:hypothetical protein